MSDDDSQNNPRVGLIAGSRRLPFRFLDWAKRDGRDVFVVGVRGEVDKGLKDEAGDGRYRECYVTEVSKVIKHFRNNGVAEVVMIGGIARAKLRPTFDMVKVALRLLFMRNRHKGVFTILMSMFDKGGVRVRGIHELMPELLIGEGALGKVKPSDGDIEAFTGNLSEILEFVRTGAGQAVIIYDGQILAYEGLRGTDEIVSRAAAIRGSMGGERGGVMVKIMEPGQDERADLPVVGTGTVETLAKHGIDGVVVEAGRAIVDDMADTVRLADELGVFVYGVRIT